MTTGDGDTYSTFVSELKHSSQTTVSLALVESHVTIADFDVSKHDNRSHLMPAGEDIPWILKYISANKEEALLCILFSLAVGLCFILLAILFCLCCRWKKARSKGSFTISKPNAEGGTRVSSYAPTGIKETEVLLNSGTAQNSAGGRTYSSPRLIRAEYARAAASSVGGGGNTTTSSSTSNANVVGLYLSQAPKSRWSRASDATVWPLPPSAADGDALVSTITRTLPMHERPNYMTSAGSIRRTAAVASTLSPPLVSLLSQNNQNDRQTLPPHVQIHSSFAPTSPTDYLFNRQSIITDPRVAVPTSSRITSPASINSPNSAGTEALLRKPPMDDGMSQRKAMSYQGVAMSGPSYHHQHHSYVGPSHPTSPPILPAPASSPWPTRNSQITLDQHETAFAGTRDRN